LNTAGALKRRKGAYGAGRKGGRRASNQSLICNLPRQKEKKKRGKQNLRLTTKTDLQSWGGGGQIREIGTVCFRSNRGRERKFATKIFLKWRPYGGIQKGREKRMGKQALRFTQESIALARGK